MAFDAAAVRVDELTTYSAEKLVYLLSITHCRADFEAVARVLSDRESRAAQTELQLQATLADAQRKAQAHEDLLQASLAKSAEDSARVRRIAEEETLSILKVAVSKIHEAAKKKQDEVSAYLDVLLCEIYELGKRHPEELSASISMIVEETEAKLKASLAKIYSPLENPERDAVQMAPDDMALALAGPSIEVAQQRKQTVMEMVKVNKGVLAAADVSVGKSLKRKAGAVENRGASPVQISATLQERMAHPPGFSPTPRFSSSSRIYGKAGSCSSLSQTIKVGKEVASAEGSGKTLKEATPLEGTGDGREYNAPSEATRDKAAEEPAHLGDESMSLITVPVQQVERFDMVTVSKRGRGRGRTVPKEKEKSKKVSGGSGNLGRERGRGRGRSNTSGNLLLGTGNLLLDPGRSNTSGNLLLGLCSQLNRPSPVLAARTVQKYSERTENASQSRNDDIILPSNASVTGQAEMNIASGHAMAGTRGLIHVVPRSTPLKINNVSVTQLRSIPGMGGKVTENLGKCIENREDSVPVIDNVLPRGFHMKKAMLVEVGTTLEGTSHRA